MKPVILVAMLAMAGCSQSPGSSTSGVFKVTARDGHYWQVSHAPNSNGFQQTAGKTLTVHAGGIIVEGDRRVLVSPPYFAEETKEGK